MKFFGGGAFFIEAANYTRKVLTPDNWLGIDRLLKAQDYIVDVQPWDRSIYVNYNLNDFRSRLFHTIRKAAGRYDWPGKDKHLTHWMCEAHSVPYEVLNEKWLTVEPNRVAPVVVSRAGPGREHHHVYQNPSFPWHKVWKKYGKQAVFIGTPVEHAVFCASCGEVKYQPTADLYEAARVISGCDLFIGNQSCPHAIAEGLKKNIILEVWEAGPNCLVYRPGVIHGRKHDMELPDL